jgi:putative heme-binding domain-containing protein
LWRDREALPQLLQMLHKDSDHNRRAAAEAIGRIGDKSAVPALLAVLGQPTDRGLEHAFTYALIEIADAEGTAVGLKSDNPHIRRAAMTALDQMDNGKLPAAVVAAELDAKDAGLKKTASWIISRHPDWGGELAGLLRDRLAAKERSPAESEELTHHLARFAKTPAIQELLAAEITSPSASPKTRQIVFHAMAQSALKEAPAAWLAALTRFVGAGERAELADALAAIRALQAPKKPPKELMDALGQIGASTETPVGIRLAALAAMPGGPGKIDQPLFLFLFAQLRPENEAGPRGVAADVLARAKLTTDQLLYLTGAFETIGPMEVDRLLEAYTQSTDEKVGQHLLAVLTKSPIRSSLRVDAIKQRLAKYPPSVQKQAEELYTLIDVDREKQKVHLEKLLASTKSGDVRRGQSVFHSTKAACFSCHAVGYRGGTVGPDLTRIGAIRTERDLLESIVFPSASFVRGYEPVLVATKDGKSHNGLLRKDAPDEIVLVVAPDKEERIPRSEIEAIEPSKVSVMPAGLDQQLSVQDLADLVAFLKACK